MATTNGNAAGHGHGLPEIILDTTLAELLAEEPGCDGNEALCNIKPCADARHKALPLNEKYLITSSQIDDENDLAHLQLENVNYLLSFWAGPLELPLMACEGWSNDDTLTAETINNNAQTAFSVLTEKQRPRPKAFSNRNAFIDHYGHDNNQIRWGFAVDFAERMPYFIHPELHYKLNTKRWLAECSLRSANDRILDPECSCAEHTTKDGLWYFGSDCSNCKAEVEKEVSRLRDKLQETEPPFVLKLTQSLGSMGTMLVKSKKDRDKAIKYISEVQTEALTHINADNAHIFPASLVLSDFLPGTTNALNFYIRQDGSIKFLGACHQLSTRAGEGGRQHTALTWSSQTHLQTKFKPTLTEIGQVLHSQGYYGPCGADIMESSDNTQYVIDLNVRTSTSTILGCLQTHCKTRNFDVCSVYECLLLNLSREQLFSKFEHAFQQGRIILLGITRLGKKEIWAYPVVMAGETREEVEELGKRVLQFEATGGGDEQDAGGA